MRQKTVHALLVVLAAAIAAAAPASAAGKETPAEKQAEIEAALKSKQQAAEELKKKAGEINKEVKKLKSKLVDTSSQLRKTEETLNQTNAKLGSLQLQKKQSLEALYKYEDSLGGLVTAAGRFKRTSTPQMLLQTDSISAARAALLLKTTIPYLQSQSTALRAELAKIDTVEDKIAAEKERRAKELASMNGQQKELNALLGERQKMYKQTESARRQQEEDMKKLAAEAASLEDLVLKIKKRKRSRSEIAELEDDAGNGQTPAKAIPLPANMTAPVDGSIRTAFGGRTPAGAISKGMTFNGRPGARVVTPLSGVVRFAGPFQKYKQILIVEHRGGYHSLIAGLGSIDTVVGDKLSAGEPVGTADDDTGAVYYELRQNGTPIDPRRMLTARR